MIETHLSEAKEVWQKFLLLYSCQRPPWVIGQMGWPSHYWAIDDKRVITSC